MKKFILVLNVTIKMWLYYKYFMYIYYALVFEIKVLKLLKLKSRGGSWVRVRPPVRETRVRFPAGHL